MRKYKLADIFYARGAIDTISDLLKVERVHSRWFGEIFLRLVPDGDGRSVLNIGSVVKSFVSKPNISQIQARRFNLFVSG